MLDGLDLPQDLLNELRSEAELRGIGLSELLTRLAEELEANDTAVVATTRPPVLSFIGIGAADSGRMAAEADEMLAEGFGQS